MKNILNKIPIFFAADDRYVPFLAVALQSLVEHASEENYYLIKILYTDISQKNQVKIKKYEKNNINIEFVDLSYYIEKIQDKLYTRDYYTNTTYFRLFIPELYPQFNKALYLDSDIVILSDIAELYNIDIDNNLVIAAPDGVMQSIPVFREYSEKVVGVADHRNYFNAGVLVLNLDELRKFKFAEKFLYLLETVKFSVAQDQDYLNRICKGRVKLVPLTWNAMPIPELHIKEEDIKLVHYNLNYRPWHFDNVLYEKEFWNYAKKTDYLHQIQKIKNNYTEEDRFNDIEMFKNLSNLAQKECDCVGDDRRFRQRNPEGKTLRERIRFLERESINDVNAKPRERIRFFERESSEDVTAKPRRRTRLFERENIADTTEKSKDRLEVIEKIKMLEAEGKFDVDVENDPPTIKLSSENVDYLNKKIYSRIKNRVANEIGERYLNDIIRENKLIIKEINGIENIRKVKTGAMITCNHFNPFDSFAIEKVFMLSGKGKNKRLYKVIREGNYTNFPGLYGFFFRNCDTLPLSSNKSTMIEFIKAVDAILSRGDFILIYPEQSMWWNYRKPKPLKNGAFKLATRNNVPVIPVFITMEDSEFIGDDGFPVQEYIINIEKPIYPDKHLTPKQNVEMMRDKNFEVWKNIYEDFYQIPLEYNTDLVDKRNTVQ